MPQAHLGPYTVDLSNLDKVFYPEDGITKGDVVEYYRRVAEWMLPHLRDRPLMMQRFPDGIAGKSFYQKEAGAYFPEWIDRVEVDKEGGSVIHAVCNNTATLVYLANQACITPHVWLSRQDRIHHPDQLIFDLDPPAGDFESVRFAAKSLATLLAELDLPSFCKTTGSKGLHVAVPLDRKSDFDTVRKLAAEMAGVLARREPQKLTVETHKKKRGARLFLDYLRNSYAQTAVAPYALRPQRHAPVATPIDWAELDDKQLTSTRFHLKNIFQRLGQKQDPWKDIRRKAVSASAAQERLDRLKQADGEPTDEAPP